MASAAPKLDQEIKSTRNVLAAIGLFFGVAALIPYSGVIQILTLGQKDGKFESLSSSEYGILIWFAVILSVIFLLTACLLTIYQQKYSPILRKINQSIHGISIRKDGRELIQELAGDHDEIWFWISVLIITGIAVFLRVLYITQPVGYDEAYTFLYFATRSFRYILTDYSAPNNHIFHTILVSLSYHIFGNHIWALRLPACVSGILCIPAVYLAGKAFGKRWTGILAGLGLAFSPMMIAYSVNGRGYSLTVLFALIGLWLTGLLMKQSSFLKWFLLAVTCILGFYTIPIFLYPFGSFYLFLFIIFLYKSKNDPERVSYLSGWLLSGLAVGFVSFLLYVPVIIFGTGLSSIIGNEFVQSQGWSVFILDFIARCRRVWTEWTDGVQMIIIWAAVVGFVMKVLWDVKNLRKAFPLWLSTGIWLLLILGIQRVTPWPRVWLFLLGFTLIWSAGGWVTCIYWLVNKRKSLSSFNRPVLIGAMVVIVGLTGIHYSNHMPDNEVSHEQQAAEFIQTILQPDDTLVAVSPVPIQVGYYLSGMGIPYSRFYNRDRPHKINRAIMIFVERSKFPSLESVVSWQNLEGKVDLVGAKLLYQHKRVNIYAVPGK